MTGFGEGAAADGAVRVRARLRSVNHKYLDLNLRLPEELWSRERELEELLRSRLDRGRIELRLTMEPVGEEAVRLRVRAGVLADLREQLAELEASGLIDDRPSGAELLSLPGVVEVEGAALDVEGSGGDAVAEAVGAALEALVLAREREGGRLREFLEERRAGLLDLAGRMRPRWEELRTGAHVELEERLAGLLGSVGVEPERLAQEAALLVERSDIGEELDRLRAHLDHLGELLAAGGSLGRRIDFLSQEILRELNTAGAKCRDAEMVAWVVEAKLLCEQLREQAQNVE